jgi:pilus assembly protein FimV
VRVSPPDAYRAAGVEYNAGAAGGPGAAGAPRRRPPGAARDSDRAVLEPFVDLIIEASWASGRLVREYTLLFDPPGLAHAGARTAAMACARPPRPPRVPRAAPPRRRPRVPRRTLVPAPARPPAVRTAPAPAAVQRPRQPPPRCRVTTRERAGRHAERIAVRTQQPRCLARPDAGGAVPRNPQAFMGDNMNRLMAGACWTVPTAEECRVSTPARRAAHRRAERGLRAYRQRLASGVGGASAGFGAAPGRRHGADQRRGPQAGRAPTPDR